MNNTAVKITLFIVFLFISKPYQAVAQNNDHMFPAAEAAKKDINFDKQGFIIHGKKVFIVSAGLEYARIPHQLWRDRLLRLKRAGFNCVEIYTFWNFHEPAEGKFDFSGDHDLDAFLKQVKQLGMYCIARVGPYYCAEWDFGGYPIWLRFKEGLMLRQPNQPFEDCVGRFFDKLIPIVAANQITKGGAVILVQLENEHPEGKGTYTPNKYFTFLQKKAIELGIQVPYFFSELHHGSDPAGLRDGPFDNNKRPNPWMSTEFWSVWYSNYGSTQADADTYGRRTWKVIRDGGGGYNYYMAHGGSNFDYSNDDEDAASYDYGAAVGQTGDLRPIYYQFKRNAMFARSFQDILASAKNAPEIAKQALADTAFHVSARHSNNGDIVFLDNPGKQEAAGKLTIDSQQIPLKGKLRLAPGEIFPIVQKFELAPGVTLDWAAVRILGTSTSAKTKTMVIYGDEGSAAALKISVKQGEPKILQGTTAFSLNGSSAILTPVFDAEKPTVYLLKYGTGTIRIIALKTQLADRTWFVNDQQKEYVITGPEYVGEVSTKQGRLTMSTEHFWEQKNTLPVWVFDEAGIHTKSNENKPGVIHAEDLPFSNAWQYLDAGQPASPGFDDSKWLKGKDAAQMGTDGDLSCYAWYRANVNVRKAGNYILKVREGGDRAVVYIDNVKTAAVDIKKETAFPLIAGRHSFAVFTSHAGRDKFFNHIGEANHKDAKGLYGAIYLQNGKTAYLDNWKTIMAKSAKDTEQPVPSFDNAQPYQVNEDVFKNHLGFAWFQTEIPLRDGAAPKSLFCRGFNDAMVVFINGKQVLTKMKTESFNLDLTSLFKIGEKNTITIFVNHDRTYYKGGLTNNVEVVYQNPDDVYLANWAMKGGPGNNAALSGWQPLNTLTSDRPAFLKNTFKIENANTDIHAMWRVTYEGLSRGSIWINGHNLGRYPEKIRIKSLYIPECWLVKGENTIVVFDEDGNRPDKITINAEKVASRDVGKIVMK